MESRNKKLMLSTMVLVLTLGAGILAAADARADSTWYVSQTGTGNSLCIPNDPTLAFADIQSAVDCASAQSGKNNVSIEGTTANNVYFLNSTLYISKGGPVLLVGTGAVKPTIHAGDKFLAVSNTLKAQGGLEIRNVQITGGEGTNGGGIYNSATLTLTNVDVVGNDAKFGGGLYNDGTLTIKGGSVTGNRAKGDVGYLSAGTATCTQCSIDPVNSWIAHGGGIYNTGSLTIDGAVIGSNVATTEDNPWNSAGCASGGGIFNTGIASCGIDQQTGTPLRSITGGGTVTITNSKINTNDVWGGLEPTQHNDAGPGSANGGGIFNFAGSVSVASSEVNDNFVRCTYLGCASGGGIVNLDGFTLRDGVNVNLNTGSPTLDGGGIYNSSAAKLTIKSGVVTIAFNSASEGAGIYNYGIFSGSGTCSSGGAACGEVVFGSGTSTYFQQNLSVIGNDQDQCGPIAGINLPGKYNGSGTVYVVKQVSPGPPPTYSTTKTLCPF